jgi:hypothetical protein
MKTKWPSMSRNWCLWMSTTNKWACVTMYPRKQRLVTARMSADLAELNEKPAPSERVLFWVYRLATSVTFTVIDDAAMLAFVFS